MELAGLFLCFWALLVLCRGTPFGIWLHGIMVERPAAGLSRLRRTHLVGASVSIVLVALLAWSGGDDAIRVLAMAAPDLVAWLSMVELSVILDSALAVVAAVSAVRSGAVRSMMRGAFTSVRQRARAAPVRRPQATTADNDDDSSALTVAA